MNRHLKNLNNELTKLSVEINDLDIKTVVKDYEYINEVYVKSIDDFEFKYLVKEHELNRYSKRIAKMIQVDIELAKETL